MWVIERLASRAAVRAESTAPDHDRVTEPPALPLGRGILTDR